ncbi:MarR family winged helix-turn-helix transcriptional regulator [Haliscomenobacter hydrossis]|uniref:Regulatory protein MarR n=1 Tax=Haliscomenobacter hydrossis (strain ATCC 27775 / DSM 1100 / LMG 10767 / O) TaxID=760192 RepID=F4L2B2_HALH1|nr:MarR family winged helix-turn-helix transcriptional regulator [Haliscomenobacter hydrossis]AEE52865.1 regulatory protein MarR [Haliscomenobacter hydrossis DSM 1100]
MTHSVFDLNDQHHSLEAKITLNFGQIALALRTMLWQQCFSINLSPIQGQILIFCLNHPPQRCRIGYLAKEFSLTKPTISDAVKTLERKQLLSKKNDPDDQRSFDLILTPKGVETAQKVLSFANPLYDLVAELPEGKKHQLNLVLSQLTIHLKESGILSSQRSCVSCQHHHKKSSKKIYHCNFYGIKMAAPEIRLNCADYLPLPNQE